MRIDLCIEFIISSVIVVIHSFQERSNDKGNYLLIRHMMGNEKTLDKDCGRLHVGLNKYLFSFVGISTLSNFVKFNKLVRHTPTLLTHFVIYSEWDLLHVLVISEGGFKKGSIPIDRKEEKLKFKAYLNPQLF